MKLDQIFSRLWEKYSSENPSVKKIHRLFNSKGEIVNNDHIAFRTFNNPFINIDALARIFIENGYEENGSYVFEQKHLDAKHFELKTEPNAPKIFISELRIQDFSSFLQDAVRKIIGMIPENIINSDELVFSGTCWGPVSYEIYMKLRKESEYAAWLYVYGFRANHFTININTLNKYNSIEKVNELLKNNGYLLNTSGGEIKGTKEQLLKQSSIMSDIMPYDFEEGEKEIPGCYYEFAERFKDKNGNLFQGFIAKSADKIFESTDFYSKKIKIDR